MTHTRVLVMADTDDLLDELESGMSPRETDIGGQEMNEKSQYTYEQYREALERHIFAEILGNQEVMGTVVRSFASALARKANGDSWGGQMSELTGAVKLIQATLIANHDQEATNTYERVFRAACEGDQWIADKRAEEVDQGAQDDVYEVIDASKADPKWLAKRARRLAARKRKAESKAARIAEHKAWTCTCTPTHECVAVRRHGEKPLTKAQMQARMDALLNAKS